MIRTFTATAAVLSVLAFSAQAQVEYPAREAADGSAYAEVLAEAYPADQPGAAALVARGGEILFLGASGMANLEFGIPLEADMVFEIGSITKQFTAAAIMMLAEAGKLSVQDSITRFLPDYPVRNVTVEHLLTHTSGIVSYTGIPGYMAAKIRNDVSVDELIAVFKDLPVEFQPGERWAYNNSGYILLGAIIERVSGMKYEDFIQQRIFDRLGMTHSYYGSHSRLIAKRVSGYQGSPGEYVNANFLSMTQPYAAGSLMMTVEDLLRWNQALHNGELISRLSVKRMTTPFVLNNGDTTTYGYGLGVQKLRDRPAIRHGGGIFGFTTDGTLLPEDDVFVAVFSNNTAGGAAPGFVATKLAAIAVGQPYPAWTAVTVNESILNRYVGVYQINDDAKRTVTLEDGRLYTQRSGSARLEAIPSSETHFFYRQSLSHFEFEVEDGKATQMLMHQGGAEEVEQAIKVSDEVAQPIDLNPAIFDLYVGVYELQPGFDLTITREDDRLMAQATGQPKVQLHPESETEFYITEVDAQVTFVTGSDGRAVELILHQGGRDMPARRKS